MTKDPWNYADMLTDLTAGRKFSFVRYSDGDWNCFFGRKGKVVNEHTYDPDLGAALRSALRPEPSAGYHVGIMGGLLIPDKWWASNRVISYTTAHPEMAFCSSMLLHCASMAGTLGAFFDALRGRRLIVVGNAGMTGMRPWLGDFEHVVIPDQECWQERAQIEPRIIEACRTADVALFSCSMPAKVWIRHAWDAGTRAALVDVGAVFDPYIGRLSRNYMRAGRHVLAPQLYTG